jgi:hypothetical protein
MVGTGLYRAFHHPVRILRSEGAHEVVSARLLTCRNRMTADPLDRAARYRQDFPVALD